MWVFLIIISLALIGWNPIIGIILTALLVWFLISKSKQDNLKRSMNHHSQQLESCYGPNGLLKCPACGTSTKLSRWIRVDVLATRQEVSDGYVTADGRAVPSYRTSSKRYTIMSTTTDYNTIKAEVCRSGWETVEVKKIDLVCPSCSKELNYQQIQELTSKAIQTRAEKKAREPRLICQDCNVSSPESDWAEHGCCPNCGSDREPYPDPKSPVNMISEEKKAPIINAVDEGNLELVRQLIKAGADVNVKDKDVWCFGEFPITLAALLGHLEIVQELIKAGADVNPSGDSTPLHAAADRKENLEIVQELIKAGADVNAKDNDGCTTLRSAAEKNTWKLFRN